MLVLSVSERCPLYTTFGINSFFYFMQQNSFSTCLKSSLIRSLDTLFIIFFWVLCMFSFNFSFFFFRSKIYNYNETYNNRKTNKYNVTNGNKQPHSHVRWRHPRFSWKKRKRRRRVSSSNQRFWSNQVSKSINFFSFFFFFYEISFIIPLSELTNRYSIFYSFLVVFHNPFILNFYQIWLRDFQVIWGHGYWWHTQIQMHHRAWLEIK